MRVGTVEPDEFAKAKALGWLITKAFIGAGNRVRTGDIQLGKLTLYQLSYARAPANIPEPLR